MPGGVHGVLTAAGLVFFAFAGYARIATLAEEVRDPSRTLRKAIAIALGVTVVTYLLVAAALLAGLGAERLSMESAPLVAVVDSGQAPALGVLVRVGAAVAAGSALLSVLVGTSRTALAMARRGELPRSLAAVGGRGTPWRADIAGGAVAVIVAVVAGPAAAIALSACAVLVYYAVVNLAALRLLPAERSRPHWMSWAGLVACLLLAALLPPQPGARHRRSARRRLDPHHRPGPPHPPPDRERGFPRASRGFPRASRAFSARESGAPAAVPCAA